MFLAFLGHGTLCVLLVGLLFDILEATVGHETIPPFKPSGFRRLLVLQSWPPSETQQTATWQMVSSTGNWLNKRQPEQSGSRVSLNSCPFYWFSGSVAIRPGPCSFRAGFGCNGDRGGLVGCGVSKRLRLMGGPARHGEVRCHAGRRAVAPSSTAAGQTLFARRSALDVRRRAATWCRPGRWPHG